MKYTHTPLFPILTLLVLFTSSARATCYPTPTPTDGDHYIYRPTAIQQDINLNPSTAPLGAVFGRIYLQMGMNAHQGSYTCENQPFTLTLEIPGNPPPDNYGSYPSGVPGIGFRSIKINNRTFPGSIISANSSSLIRTATIHDVTVELIKTGPTSSIGTFHGTLALEKASGQTVYEYKFDDLQITLPQKPTCNLEPIPTVPLGTHSMNRFTGQDTVTAPQDFDVVMTCAGGDAGSSINATLTFTDNTNMANTSDALSLNTTHVRGVSVQILRNGSPVRFGPQNASSGSPNVHELGAIPQQGQGSFNYRIPLQARYKQTSSSVSGAGQANAEAILTLNYQ